MTSNQLLEHMRTVTIACEDLTHALSDMQTPINKVKHVVNLINISHDLSNKYDEARDKRKDKSTLEVIYIQWCKLYRLYSDTYCKVIPC